MEGDFQLIILDDDPTGIQTVHGCLLVTCWQRGTLRRAFQDSCRFFYILTNTRAESAERTEAIIAEAVENVLEVNREFGYSLVFISRSDSTLRSHFPLEIETIRRAVETAAGREVEAIFLAPAFFEGGRVTADDTHYLVTPEGRLPTSSTEFARDSVFGYSTSYLPDYIQEKTGGRVAAGEVLSVPLTMLRREGKELEGFLSVLMGGDYVVVNAESYADLDRFSAAVRAQVGKGRLFLFQSAASMVKSLAQVPDKPLLDRTAVLGDKASQGQDRGLFVIGSHVGRSTSQLRRLLEEPAVRGIEIEVRELLKEPQAVMVLAKAEIRAALATSRSPVLYTSRQELTFPSREMRLEAGRKISFFLASLVRELEYKPSFLVAKGGITSHDILVRGLGVEAVRVLGQLLPGVPVVEVPDGKGRGMPYVIFPGNVGEEDALLRLYRLLRAPPDGRLALGS